MTDVARRHVGGSEFKTGYDVDLIGGYDFGMFRLEGELGYKRAKAKSVRARRRLRDRLQRRRRHAVHLATISTSAATPASCRAWSTALVDFGGNGGVGGYVGGGFGHARVKEFGDSDSAWAWQLLAGVYTPVSDNIDVGLKYRYFRTGKLNFNDELRRSTAVRRCDRRAAAASRRSASTTISRSHSLLASLIYNFGAAGRRRPRRRRRLRRRLRRAPATQTCPDGSVILATSACPAPPPPPPPPPAERPASAALSPPTPSQG